MTIKSVLQFLESIAPSIYQESYDNAGLIVGYPSTEITGVLCCLDATEAVVDEAINKNCNLIVAHHPIVFKGLKRFNGKNYVERVVMKAIKNDIAIYAIHTNLDNMLYQGVNTRIAERLGLKNTRILAPKSDLKKLIAFADESAINQLKHQLFEIGVGTNHTLKNNSYVSLAATTIGGQGKAKVKLELLFPSALQRQVISLLNQFQTSSSFSYQVHAIENSNHQIGSGMMGELPRAMSEKAFFNYLKEQMQVTCIKHTQLSGKTIKKVAFCGGAGGFLLRKAIGALSLIHISEPTRPY